MTIKTLLGDLLKEFLNQTNQDPTVIKQIRDDIAALKITAAEILESQKKQAADAVLWAKTTAAILESLKEIREFLEIDSETLSDADQKTLDQIKDEAEQVRTQAEGIDASVPVPPAPQN